MLSLVFKLVVVKAAQPTPWLMVPVVRQPVSGRLGFQSQATQEPMTTIRRITTFARAEYPIPRRSRLRSFQAVHPCTPTGPQHPRRRRIHPSRLENISEIFRISQGKPKSFPALPSYVAVCSTRPDPRADATACCNCSAVHGFERRTSIPRNPSSPLLLPGAPNR